ncbi:MAG: hypothetical protein AAB530_02540 [Patescibacteria group bacterium]
MNRAGKYGRDKGDKKKAMLRRMLVSYDALNSLTSDEVNSLDEATYKCISRMAMKKL